MEIYSIDFKKIPNNLEPTSCCIGYFDGLHAGHQALLDHCIHTAKENHIKSGLITFDPDPWKIFYPERICKHITTLEDRKILAKSMGIEVFYVIRFSKEFASLDTNAFNELLSQMQVKALTCGFDFKYASKNMGNIHTLLEQDEFKVSVIESINSNNEKISSSRIEPLIQSGKLDAANDLLGYMYSISGSIEHGFKRGSSLLTFPTANLKVNPEYLIPSSGVYAGFVSIENVLYPCMINVGNNPTFQNKKTTIEAHIFDFHQDIYNENVRFYFLKKTRNEVRFSNFQALKNQLQKDIISCKDVILKNQNFIQETGKLWRAKVFEFNELF